MKWNIILNKMENNHIFDSENNPKESGTYLCTCVQFWQEKEIRRYLQIMTYEKENNYWHDCDNKYGISHTILAWTKDVSLCDFQNFDYYCGILLEK